MADGDMSRHRGESLLIAYLADQTEILEYQHLGTVGDRDTRRLLTAVLQRVQAVVGELGDFLAGSPDAEDAALFTRFAFQLAGHGPPWRVGGRPQCTGTSTSTGNDGGLGAGPARRRTALPSTDRTRGTLRDRHADSVRAL